MRSIRFGIDEDDDPEVEADGDEELCGTAIGDIAIICKNAMSKKVEQ